MRFWGLVLYCIVLYSIVDLAYTVFGSLPPESGGLVVLTFSHRWGFVNTSFNRFDGSIIMLMAYFHCHIAI